jgi:hypothetical protein
MNEPWNRFVLPSTPSFLDENIESSASQPIPAGGILGKFGQNVETPPMGLRPAATAPMLPAWSQTWPFASPAQTPDSDTLRFRAAWRRLYSSPAFSAHWLPGNIPQPGAQFSVSATSFPISAPDFTSAAVDELPRRVDPYSGRWQRPATISKESDNAPYSPSTGQSPNPMAARETMGAQNPPEILSDVTPDNDWIPGAEYAGKARGHHEFLQSQFRDMPPETRKVFDEATSGKLFVGRRQAS